MSDKTRIVQIMTHRGLMTFANIEAARKELPHLFPATTLKSDAR
jgi:hypothetical protein